MTRSMSQDAPIVNPLISAMKWSVGKRTLGADITLSATDAVALSIDPTADNRKVICPTVTEANTGRVYFIYNAADAAESILVRSPADAGTIGTIAQGEMGLVVNLGAAGWVCMVGANT